jgi:hypothetical protein
MLTPEQDLAARFVRFLNLDIQSTEQVEGHFAEAALVGGLMKVIRPDEAQNYRDLQQQMRGVVAKLADAFGKPRKVRSAAHALAPRVDAELARTPLQTRFYVAADDTLEATYTLDGVVQCCWVAVGLLIDAERGFRGRLGRCGAPSCGRLVVSFEHKPRRHCNAAHGEAFRRLSGVKRVQRHRKKKELERKQREAARRARADRAAQNKED